MNNMQTEDNDEEEDDEDNDKDSKPKAKKKTGWCTFQCAKTEEMMLK